MESRAEPVAPRSPAPVYSPAGQEQRGNHHGPRERNAARSRRRGPPSDAEKGSRLHAVEMAWAPHSLTRRVEKIRMTRTRISRSLRQRVVAEFCDQCAYCHTLTSITGARLVIDHIVPEVAGGQTVRENLCLACHSCNEFKGAQVEAQDPLDRRKRAAVPSAQTAMERALLLERRWQRNHRPDPCGTGYCGCPEHESPRHRRSPSPLGKGRLASPTRGRPLTSLRPLAPLLPRPSAPGTFAYPIRCLLHPRNHSSYMNVGSS